MDMDINTVRGLATLLALVAFIAMIAWAYSSKRKTDFDEAASLPFAENDLDAHSHSNGSSMGSSMGSLMEKAERTNSQTEESKNNE